MSLRTELLAAAFALSFASACGHTETHVAMLRPRAPALQHDSELYLAHQPLPARPFSEIAIVQAVGYGDDAETEEVVSALRKRAGSLGCDAVIRVNVDVGYSRAHAAGVCVRWLGPSVGGPVPPSREPGEVAGPQRPLLGPTVVPTSTPTPRPEPLPSDGLGSGN